MQYNTAQELIRDLSEQHETIKRDQLFNIVCNYFYKEITDDDVEEESNRLGLSSTNQIKKEIDSFLSMENPKDSKFKISHKSVNHIGNIIKELDRDISREQVLSAVCRKLEERYRNLNYLEPALKKMKIPTTKEIKYAIDLYYAGA